MRLQKHVNVVKGMYYQFLRGVADMVDHSPLWFVISSDILQIAMPLALGQKRHRPFDPRVKLAVSEAVAAGHMARSTNKLGVSLKRFSPTDNRVEFSKAIGKNWLNDTMGGQYEYRRVTFRGLNNRLVSLSMDATRMGGIDTLYIALHSRETCLTVWASLQVSGSVDDSVNRTKYF